MNTELGAANVGAPNRLELNFYGQLDSSCIGFMGYSRSGSLVPELVEPFAAGGTPIASIANCGASYPVPDSPDAPWVAPLAADIPVLDVMGLTDGDVDGAPALFASKYLSPDRSAPHLLAMPEQARQAPLNVTAKLENGTSVPLELDAHSANALRNRSGELASIYPSNTLRFVLPTEARNSTIAALTISSDDAAVLSLQQVDVLRES